MLTIDYCGPNKGWSKPKIIPYGPFSFKPSTTCLHYGISAFEGFSVYKNRYNGSLQAFRAIDYLEAFK
jgi:branched-chain amino acid aminotransferase